MCDPWICYPAGEIWEGSTSNPVSAMRHASHYPAVRNHLIGSRADVAIGNDSPFASDHDHILARARSAVSAPLLCSSVHLRACCLRSPQCAISISQMTSVSEATFASRRAHRGMYRLLGHRLE